MKGLIVFTLSFCVVFVVCFADDDHVEFRDFVKCVACAAHGSPIREKYQICSAKKPETLKGIMKECCAKVMPEAAGDEDAAWDKFCHAGDEVLDEICSCVKGEIAHHELTEDDIAHMADYKKCAHELHEAECHD